MSRQQKYKQGKIAAGLCRNCPAPRVDGTYCQACREDFRAKAKEARRVRTLPYIIDPANTCKLCGAVAAYGVFLITPTEPCSANWVGKSMHAVSHYCEEHAQTVEAPIASVRRLRAER